MAAFGEKVIHTDGIYIISPFDPTSKEYNFLPISYSVTPSLNYALIKVEAPNFDTDDENVEVTSVRGYMVIKTAQINGDKKVTSCFQIPLPAGYTDGFAHLSRAVDQKIDCIVSSNQFEKEHNPQQYDFDNHFAHVDTIEERIHVDRHTSCIFNAALKADLVFKEVVNCENTTLNNLKVVSCESYNFNIYIVEVPIPRNAKDKVDVILNEGKCSIVGHFKTEHENPKFQAGYKYTIKLPSDIYDKVVFWKMENGMIEVFIVNSKQFHSINTECE